MYFSMHGRTILRAATARVFPLLLSPLCSLSLPPLGFLSSSWSRGDMRPTCSMPYYYYYYYYINGAQGQ